MLVVAALGPDSQHRRLGFAQKAEALLGLALQGLGNFCQRLLVELGRSKCIQNDFVAAFLQHSHNRHKDSSVSLVMAVISLQVLCLRMLASLNHTFEHGFRCIEAIDLLAKLLVLTEQLVHLQVPSIEQALVSLNLLPQFAVAFEEVSDHPDTLQEHFPVGLPFAACLVLLSSRKQRVCSLEESLHIGLATRHRLDYLIVSGSLQQLLVEFLNLILKTQYVIVLRIPIYHRLILYFRGFGSVGEGGEVFVQEGIVGADARHHQAVAVAAYRMFQEGCQFRLPVGNVARGVFRKGRDYLAQCKQRLVDVYALFGEPPFAACLTCSF